MGKYKVCPLCGKHNDPVMLECIECESDLSGVPIVDEETEKKQQDSSAEVVNQRPQLIRLCECGTKNPVQARKCAGCGEDISDVVPTDDCADGQLNFVLSTLDGEYAYEIEQPITTIGRECEMKDYLEKKPYVSRRHAELLFEEDKLFIKNLSGTNFTYVNNEKIDESESTELHDGDEIGLGGIEKNGSRQVEAAYFMVRIGTCM